MPAGRPLKFQSAEELQQKIDEYFESCWTETPITDKKGKEVGTNRFQTKPYTITGLALYLDTSRQTLLEYEGEVEGRDTKDPAFADTIKKAKQRCENWVEENALQNKINPTTAIFNLKNNFKWKDQTEVDHTSKGEQIGGFNYVTPKDDNPDN